MEKETKLCPFCGESILAVAKKCKHCGEFLDGLTRRNGDKQTQKPSFSGVIPYHSGIKILCPVCGYEGAAKKDVPGSIWIEIVLWLFMIIPGLIYSIWRLTASSKCKCPKCGNEILTMK